MHKNIIIDPVNHTGGIWVCWNTNNICLQNQFTTDRFAHLEILYRPSNKVYSIIGTYCPAQTSDKNIFWPYLNQFLIQVPNPWLLLDDFNEMILHLDKLGGAPIKHTQLHRLFHLLQQHNAIDILCHHQAFSWKGFSNNDPIYKRLDRAISTMQFYNDFNQSALTYSNSIVFDHAPILFSSNVSPLTKPPAFRFQNFWVVDKESHSIVKKHWKHQYHRLPLLSNSAKITSHQSCSKILGQMQIQAHNQ